MDSSLVKKYKEEITNEFIKALDEKGLNWKKDWVDNYTKCENAYGGSYNLLNNFRLGKFMNEKGYFDNRFYTFKQAEKLGFKVKKGEKSIGVLQKIPYVSDKNGTYRIVKWSEYYNTCLLNKDIFDINKLDSYVSQQIAFLFNAHQLEGIELKSKPEVNNKINDNDAIKAISEEMGVPIVNRYQDNIFENGAYYNQLDDKIYIPNKERFSSSSGYNATCLHELGHATGAEKRLNRETLKDYGKDIKIRAREELVAEITSAYMSVHIENIDNINDKDDLANHKAYINSWASLLKEDKDLIFDCFSKAEKATEYLTNAMEKGLDKIKNLKIEDDINLDKGSSIRDKFSSFSDNVDVNLSEKSNENINKFER